MNKICPFRCTDHYISVECNDKCVMHDGNGCLIKQAFKSYVDEHKPLRFKLPTDEEIAELVG